VRATHIYRTACVLTGGDTHLAEDLMQETLGRMYAVWGRRRRIENPAGGVEDGDADLRLTALKLSAGMVRSRSGRALARLRDQLGADFPECADS
jgi:DNA-directed RNA polymerase specialized sigma24 family protein